LYGQIFVNASDVVVIKIDVKLLESGEVVTSASSVAVIEVTVVVVV